MSHYSASYDVPTAAKYGIEAALLLGMILRASPDQEEISFTSDEFTHQTAVSSAALNIAFNKLKDAKVIVGQIPTTDNPKWTVRLYPAPVKNELSKSDTEMDKLFAYWQERVGYPVASNMAENQKACARLMGSTGLEGTKRLIDGVALSHTDKYAPRISDFVSLAKKRNELMAWGHRRVAAQHGTIKGTIKVER